MVGSVMFSNVAHQLCLFMTSNDEESRGPHGNSHCRHGPRIEASPSLSNNTETVLEMSTLLQFSLLLKMVSKLAGIKISQSSQMSPHFQLPTSWCALKRCIFYLSPRFLH